MIQDNAGTMQNHYRKDICTDTELALIFMRISFKYLSQITSHFKIFNLKQAALI